MCVVVVPALWVVDRAVSDVYLFGETVGVGPDDVWFVEPVRTAFRDAGQLWCEVADVDDLVRSPFLGAYGMSDAPLSARLGSNELDRLRAAAEALRIDVSTLDGLRPWLAGQVLEHAHRSQLSVAAAADVHGILVGLAKQAGKPIRTELPDAEATLRVLRCHDRGRGAGVPGTRSRRLAASCDLANGAVRRADVAADGRPTTLDLSRSGSTWWGWTC